MLYRLIILVDLALAAVVLFLVGAALAMGVDLPLVG